MENTNQFKITRREFLITAAIPGAAKDPSS
jgi:hypothetical protein